MNKITSSLIAVLFSFAIIGSALAAETKTEKKVTKMEKKVNKMEKVAKKETNKASITIESVGDQMKFNKSSVTVNDKSEVTLTFVNKSATLGHNWVLVKSGTGDKVATAGIGAGEAKNFLPNGDKDVIAYTPFAKPGQTVKVKFKAPKKGTYDYVCTSPGHNMMMKGTLIVK